MAEIRRGYFLRIGCGFIRSFIGKTMTTNHSVVPPEIINNGIVPYNGNPNDIRRVYTKEEIALFYSLKLPWDEFWERISW